MRVRVNKTLCEYAVVPQNNYESGGSGRRLVEPVKRLIIQRSEIKLVTCGYAEMILGEVAGVKYFDGINRNVSLDKQFASSVNFACRV